VLDFVAIFPFSLVFSTASYNSMVRMARLPKLYRLIKMMKYDILFIPFRLVRLLKVVKERTKISRFINESLKMSIGMERLFTFILIVMIMTHVFSCMWYFIAKLEDFTPESWVVQSGLLDAPEEEVSSNIVNDYRSMWHLSILRL
jgi:hypothetical protein